MKNKNKNKNKNKAYEWWTTTSLHGGDFLVIITEFVLNRIPMKLSHFVFILIMTWTC